MDTSRLLNTYPDDGWNGHFWERDMMEVRLETCIQYFCDLIDNTILDMKRYKMSKPFNFFFFSFLL